MVEGTEPPKLKAPANACDCHHHIYGSQYKVDPRSTLRPGDATVEDYRPLQKRIGTSRNVVVQPSTYGTENAPTLDAVAAFGPKARAVVVVDTGVSDADLKQMHDQGARGIRFNLAQAGATTPEDDRTAARQADQRSRLAHPDQRRGQDDRKSCRSWRPRSVARSCSITCCHIPQPETGSTTRCSASMAWPSLKIEGQMNSDPNAARNMALCGHQERRRLCRGPRLRKPRPSMSGAPSGTNPGSCLRTVSRNMPLLFDLRLALGAR